MLKRVSLLPKLPPHRPNAVVKAAHEDKVEVFCEALLEVRSRLDFDPGSRGWAYILEGDRLIDKDEIDAAQELINRCRKSGNLPLDICSEDDKRAADNLEDLDPDPQERADDLFDYVQTAEQDYTPFSFWGDLDVYVQVAVEKSNIKNLFGKVCAEFYVPIANLGGWADLNVRPRAKGCRHDWQNFCCYSEATSRARLLLQPPQITIKPETTLFNGKTVKALRLYPVTPKIPEPPPEEIDDEEIPF
jgi:hypothetical protein